jgi:hypothetical protein
MRHIALALLLFSVPASACTTFCLRAGDRILLGRNLDFYSGIGMVMVNHRNVSKLALIAPPERPAMWTSKYGSITFNQMGKDLPYGGMNEAGLVVEQMWLDETVYPEPDHRPALQELQWIQYQLDNCASVREVIATDSLVRISRTSFATIHYLVADRQGNTAVIEFLDGKMQYRTGTDLPVPSLANSPYEDSYRYYCRLEGHAGETGQEFTDNSLERFCSAAGSVEAYDPAIHADPVQYSFNVLEQVSQEGFTRWSMVYDIPAGKIWYRTQENTRLRSIEMDDFDFSCNPEHSLALNIDTGSGGVAEQFTHYSVEDNIDFVNSVCDTVEIFRDIPEIARLYMGNYPNSLVCSEELEDE